MTIEGIVRGESPQEFLTKLSNVDEGDIQNLFNAAITHSLKHNQEIEKLRNRSYLIEILIYQILSFITFGYYSPLKTISIAYVESNINKIQLAIRETPLEKQTWKTKSDLARTFSTTKIQRAWRSCIRRKIQANKSTYEQWRAEALRRKNSDPVMAANATLKAYRETHYTFTHGQSLGNSIITMLINNLSKLFSPENYHKLNIQFRIPGTVPPVKNIDQFFSKHNYNVPSDEVIASEVLSVDANINREKIGESARTFYRSNSNITSNVPTFALLKLLPNEFIVNRFASSISRVAEAFQKEHLYGTLYAICVPRNIIEDKETNLAYCSEPYGTPTKTQAAQILDDHQKNKRARYQYRLLTSALSTTAGIRTFAFNHVAKDRNREYENKIQAFSNLFYAYTCLFNLKPNNPKELMKIIEILRNNKQYADYETIEYLIRIKRHCLSNFIILALRESIK